MEMFKYSFAQMLNAYAHYKKNRTEYYDGDTQILGLTVGVFMIIFLLSFVLFIAGIVLLAMHAKVMPTWAIIVGVISLFYMPLITVLLAALVRK